MRCIKSLSLSQYATVEKEPARIAHVVYQFLFCIKIKNIPDYSQRPVVQGTLVQGNGSNPGHSDSGKWIKSMGSSEM